MAAGRGGGGGGGGGGGSGETGRVVNLSMWRRRGHAVVGVVLVAALLGSSPPPPPPPLVALASNMLMRSRTRLPDGSRDEADVARFVAAVVVVVDDDEDEVDVEVSSLEVVSFVASPVPLLSGMGELRLLHCCSPFAACTSFFFSSSSFQKRKLVCARSFRK